MKKIMVCTEYMRDRSSIIPAVIVLVASLMMAMFIAPAHAAIVYIAQSSGGNDNLPTDGSAGALTIPAPVGVSAGRALIASIAARPRNMTVTVPPGWVLMTSTQQTAGGVSTAPGGMNLLTYYKIATVSEPASYTWTFANPTTGQGGSAVGGILVFSGIDTSAGSPINVWSERLTASGTTHSTTSITPTVTNTMIVSSISYLSAGNFANPTGITGITERLDVSAPVAANAIGTTLQMSTAPWATATATGSSQAVASGDADTGVGHLMALKPSAIDLDISMARSGPLVPGGTASYTVTVTNNGFNSEPGPLTIVDTLPAGLTYASFSGSGWSCSVSAPTVTCSRTGAVLAGATAPVLVLNVNVDIGASGTLTNTATVSGTGGDGNLANNTAVDSYTIPGAAGGFCDDFEGGMGNWTVSATGGDAGIGTQTANSPGNSLYLRWGAVSVVSKTSDLSGVSGGSIQYWVRRGDDSFSENPDNNEDLVVEYYNSSGAWQTLETLDGNGTPGEIYSRNFALPADARHASFQLRFRMTAGSGSDFDYWHVDDVCMGSATIPPPTPVAYYAMDEAAWTGAANEVIDSSGNNRHGTAVGGITTLLSPASGIKGDTCRGTNIPDNNALNTVQAVNTGVEIDSIGNTGGTISFWYRGRLDWDTGNGNNDDRTLFDATPAGGQGEFWLVLRDNGSLRFRLDGPGDSEQTLTSARYRNATAKPAGTWTHIAVTWNFSSNSMCIFVDGVLDNCRNNNKISYHTDFSTLFVGDNAGFYTNNENRGNSADGDIDEVRLYDFDMTAAQIAADMNATHACVSVDHFAINIGAAAASTCSARDIIITAQDSLNNTVTSYTGTVNIITSSNHGDWSQLPVTGTLVNGVADDGAAMYTFVAADNGVKTLALTNHHADDLTIGVVDNGLPATLSTSATINFRDNAFVITNDPIQVAGRNQAMSVAMWRRDPSTGNCAIAAGYTGNKNLDAWLTLDPSHPGGAAVPTIGALTLPIAAPAVNPGSNNLALTFVNGSANFNLSTTDVGKYVLDLRDDTRTFATGVDLLGTSNTITTRPFALAVSGVKSGSTNNPNGANATDTVFIGAGVNFEATIGAYRYNAAADGNNDGLPDAAATLAQTTAGGLAPSFNATATLTRSAAGFTPVGGTLGTLSNATFSSFSGGTQTRTDLNYTEVGSFLFDSAAPLVTNYLGTAGVSLAGTFFTVAGTQTNATRVGRFTPAYFNVTKVDGCTGGGAFTYSGQPFSLVTVTAKAVGGTDTMNYDGSLGFAKSVDLSDGNGSTAGSFGNGTLAAAGFANGAQTQTNVSYIFTAKATPPVTLKLRATESPGGDSVTSNYAGAFEDDAEIRSGRVYLYNAFGSELLTLRLPMKAEYYQDTTITAPATNPPVTGWITNGADACTVLGVAQLDLQNDIDDPAQGVNTIIIQAGRTSDVTVMTPAAGMGELSFSAPGEGGDGFADARMDLTGLSWLRFDWDGIAGEDDPTGRATFGLYRGSPRSIYLRQRY